MSRIGRVERVTSDTKVLVEIELDGSGATDIETGVGFYDYVLSQLGKHAGFDLTVHSLGNLNVCVNHTVEDTAVALGQAFKQAVGESPEIRRYGHILLPQDEVLVQAAVDVLGRPCLVHTEPEFMQTVMLGGSFYGSLIRRVWESFTHHAVIGLHIGVQAGRDPHNIVEAQFRAVARALRDALAQNSHAQNSNLHRALSNPNSRKGPE